MNSMKQNLVCGICKKILHKPVAVPCDCSQICKEHIDLIIKHENKTLPFSTTCPACNKAYNIPENGFCQMKKIKDSIEKGYHLTDEEKHAKQDLKNFLNELEKLYNELTTKSFEAPLMIADHFEEMRRKVDIRRESIIEKSHQISNNLIGKIEKCETIFIASVRDNINLDVKKEKNDLVEKFRDPNLTQTKIEAIENHFKRTHENLIGKLSEIDSMSDELKNLDFEQGPEMEMSFYGALTGNLGFEW